MWYAVIDGIKTTIGFRTMVEALLAFAAFEESGKTVDAIYVA